MGTMIFTSVRSFALLVLFTSIVSAVPPTVALERSSRMFTCDRPAPASAVGYNAMLAAIDPEVWGAGDFGQSVRMPDRDGRITRVFIWGDTLLPGGVMHHSTSILQVGGCLEVTPGQLLPDGKDNPGDHPDVFYWPQDVRRVPDKPRMVEVEARAIADNPEAPHDMFSGWVDMGWERVALVRVRDDGLVEFERWKQVGDPDGDAPYDRWTDPPPPAYFEPWGDGDPDHYAYSFKRHGLLPDGRALWSKASGWTDGQLHGWPLSRPRFEAHEHDWRPGQ